MRRLFTVCLMSTTVATAHAAEGPATADYLRCEYRVNPLGIDVTSPRLSWEMHDTRRGAVQTAYQVLVASTPQKLAADEGDLWDSGKVASDQIVSDRLRRQAAPVAHADAIGRSASGTPRGNPRRTASRPCGPWAS